MYIHTFNCQYVVYKVQIYYVCIEHYKPYSNRIAVYQSNIFRNEIEIYIRIYFYLKLTVSILWTNKGIRFYRTKQ